jgi:hypothetical protein
VAIYPACSNGFKTCKVIVAYSSTEVCVLYVGCAGWSGW